MIFYIYTHTFFFPFKIASGADRSALQKEAGKKMGDSTTNQTKCQSRGQRDMETEKIDFQVLS